MVEHGGNTRIMSNSADEQTIRKSNRAIFCRVLWTRLILICMLVGGQQNKLRKNGLISTHFSIRIYLLSIFCAIVFKNWHLTHFPYSMLVSEKSNYLPKLNKTANKSLENRTFSTNFNK